MNSKIHINKGFTLIELLVVIAIIGLLSSIVLASLSSARNKSKDSSIKSSLNSIRNAAAIYYNTNGHYGVEVNNNCATGIFSSDPDIKKAIDAVVNVGGIAATCYTSDGTINASPQSTSWAISVPLKTDTSRKFCVDSLGNATTTTTGATGGAAFAVNAVCQ